MNRMRFGALLVNRQEQVGLYLSHRVILTVPEPGSIRAITPEEFGECRVFAYKQVAIPFFNTLVAAANSQMQFQNSLEMINFFLQMPENSTFSDLYEHVRKTYGATLEDFTIRKISPANDSNNNSKRRNHMEEFDCKQEFNNKYQEALAKFRKRPNILVCGYTGSGKTSLIKAVLGDLVPPSAIGAGAPKTMGYDCYENELVRIWDSKGLELGETEEEFTEQTRRFVRERQNDPDVDNHIHLIWYTIQGPGARVTDCDRNLIRHIFNPKNVIVVVTKNDAVRDLQRGPLKAAILEMGIPEERIFFTSDEEGGSQGCRELMLRSWEMLPEAYKDAFMDAQRIDREAKIKAVYDKDGKAKGIITAATTAAVAVGVTPIPLSDAAILVPIQVGMIASLAALYGLRTEAIEKSAWPFVARLAGVMVSTSLLKLIPGLGSVVNATVAGTITGAMGFYVKSNFEETAIAKIEGRPAPDLGFDVELFKQFYAEYKKRSAN